ncbi:MAG: hypothetical protein IPI83_08035 [Sphingomonadales bacterium]|nr:hypothetical protein [Sphingomonadales bacterium]
MSENGALNKIRGFAALLQLIFRKYLLLPSRLVAHSQRRVEPTFLPEYRGIEMKKMILAAAAMALSLPGVAQAAANVTINFSGTTAVPANNDFQSQLSGLGLDVYAALGASLIANGPVSLTFEFLGSESGYSDTFSTGSGLTYTESSWLGKSLCCSDPDREHLFRWRRSQEFLELHHERCWQWRSKRHSWR